LREGISLQAFLDASSDRVLVLDGRGTILLLNQVAARALGTTVRGAVGRQVFDLLPPALATKCRAKFHWFSTLDKTVVEEDIDNGLWFRTRVVPLAPGRGPKARVAFFSTDITEQHEALERDRRRLAQSLHDEVGQTAALAKIRLVLAGRGAPPKVCRALEEVRRLLDQCVRQIWSALFQLSPPALNEKMPLDAAVRRLAAEVAGRNGLSVCVRVRGRMNGMEEAVRTAAFQAVRELLVNVVKHAHARRVSVRLERRQRTLRLEVKDDGVGGFRPRPRRTAGGGFGLAMLRRQVDDLGGRLVVDSKAGLGTHARLSLPVCGGTVSTSGK